MDAVGKKRSVILCILLVAAQFILATKAWPGAPAQGASLWVAESKGLYAVASDSGEVRSRNALQGGAESVAINPANGDVWAYANRTLHRFSSDGMPLDSISTPLPFLPLLLGAPTGMVVDEKSGNLWLSLGRNLYRFDLQGRLGSTTTLSAPVIGITLDRTNAVLWVAQKSKFSRYDPEGNLLSDVMLKAGSLRIGNEAICTAQLEGPGSALGNLILPQCIHGLAYDPYHREVWVSLSNRLQRYDQDGKLNAEYTLDARGALSADGAGGVWVAHRRSLVHVDPDGNQDLEIEAFSAIEGLLPITALAADPLSTTVWVTNERLLKHFDLAGQVLHQLPPRVGSGLIHRVLHLALHADAIPPEIRIISPQHDALLNATPEVILEYSDDVGTPDTASIEINLNDEPATSVCTPTETGANCTLTGPLPQGAVRLSATVADTLGNRSDPAVVNFTFDSVAPAIEITYPSEGFITNQVELNLQGTVDETATVKINGIGVPFGETLGFSHPAELQEGTNTFTVTAVDPAGNIAEITRSVTRDTIAPGAPVAGHISIGEPVGGIVAIIGSVGSAEPNARIRIRNRRTGQSVTATVAADGSFIAQIAAEAGDELDITAVDAADNDSETVILPVVDNSGLPPDPTVVATPLSKTEVTPFGESVAFLYSGAKPIQTGVSPGTIDDRRVAVIRGRVLNRNNNPLSGVTVRIKDHPELGQTLSRADGYFDLAVNGGGLLTLDYQRIGYLPSQRQIRTTWRDFVIADEVVLIPVDERVTEIAVASPVMQVASGNPVTDADGTRQATMVFQPDTTAEMVLPDGGRQSLDQLSVRATEYTVGGNGPKAMPGELPPSSGYTYAVELSVDQAEQVGAISVEFNKPVWIYVDNFLGFPVGSPVPAGWYDRAKAAWIPSDNGKVLKLLSVADGLAELDITGSGTPADAAAYQSLGITDAEREQIASRFVAGHSFWRVGATHFTPWDYNWPYGPPEDAKEPKQPPAKSDEQIDDPSIQCGSIIECQNQVLSERIPIGGTSLSLMYRSDRALGRKVAYTLDIPLSGSQIPASLRRIELHIDVAGRKFRYDFAAATNRRYRFLWDGKDTFGRVVQGKQTARVSVGYVYQAVYYEPEEFQRSFARFSGSGAISRNVARGEVALWQHGWYSLGVSGVSSAGLGDWSLPTHHTYDFQTRSLSRGDGDRGASTRNSTGVITTIAGSGNGGRFNGDNIPAIQAQIDPGGIDLAPDGSIYMADSDNHRIRRIGLDGIITTIAGTGDPGLSGDGGPAALAQLNNPAGIAVAPDGSVYVADLNNHRIRRIGADGVISTVAGSYGGYGGDGGTATAAQLSFPADVAVGSDGSLYIADRGNQRIRRVGPDGVVTTLAGTGQGGFSGDGGRAAQARLNFPLGVEVAADGSVYIVDYRNHRIRRINVDGTISTVAGGVGGSGNNGGLATEAILYYPEGVAIDRGGSLYIGDSVNNRISRVDASGIISTLAGTGQPGHSGDGGPATLAELYLPSRVALAVDGSLYIVDWVNWKIRRVESPFPEFDAQEIMVASESGEEIYVFTSAGLHLQTKDSRTGAVLYQFGYNGVGGLVSVVEGSGDVTVIERDSAGKATAIVAPDGQRTMLVVNERDHLVNVISPANETWQMSYTGDGLLTHFTDPRNHTSQFTYDDLGRLTRDTNAADGFYEFVRSEQERGYTVVKTSAESRTTTYRVEHLTTGGERYTTTAPDGTQAMTLRETTATTTDTAADGTVTARIEGPDPRFGMQSPVTTSLKVTTPGGRVSNVTGSRTATLSDSSNPLSLISLTDQFTFNGNIWRSVYTAADRQIAETSPENRQITTFVDELFRPLSRQAGGLLPIHSAYDSRGRLATLAQGAGDDARTTTFAYGTDGYLASITDPANKTISYERDPVGRVTKQTFSDSREARFTYDPNGNLTSIIPPGRDAHMFTYDAVNQIDDYTPPEIPEDATVTRYHYNADKQLSSIERPDGQLYTLDYDGAGRLQSLNTAPGAIVYGYDPTTGQLNSIQAPGGRLSYGYDGFLPIQESTEGLFSTTVSRGYDNNFWLRSLSLDGEAVDFDYDADGLLIQAGVLGLIPDSQNGLLRSTSLGPLETTQDYNPHGELQDLRARYDGDDLYAAHYVRDKLGRIRVKQETIQGVETQYGYEYDSAGRLVQVTVDGYPATTYVYDANGNRRWANAVEGSYDAQDRMTRYGDIFYGHGLNGERRTRTDGGATTRYDYDALGNLLRVELPADTVIDYRIDGRNRRIAKLVNGQVRQGFVYQDQLRLIAELDSNGDLVSRFVYADRGNIPSYMVKHGQTYRIVSDHLGSPRLVVNSATGEVVQRMDFDEFGNVTQDTNPGFQPFGFAGGLYDPHTQLTRFGARDYDPEVGRWTAKDPILFAAGDPNLYGYILNDPVNLVDPAGLTPFDGLGSALGTVVAAIGSGLQSAVGASVLSAGPGINSDFERQLVEHYFFGEGQDFHMSPDQTSRYNQNPNGPEFDYGIGRSNSDPSGRIDRYDFDPQPWGQRTIPAEIATRIARRIGDTFGGDSFDVFPNRSGPCP